MSGREIVVAPVAGSRFEPDPIPEDAILAGRPIAGDRRLGEWGDGIVSGIWRCLPGRFTDVEVDETFVVLEGRATIRTGSQQVEVGPGDVCMLPAGAETEWTVHERLLKVYVLREDEGEGED